jgi:hypothetical protein
MAHLVGQPSLNRGHDCFYEQPVTLELAPSCVRPNAVHVVAFCQIQTADFYNIQFGR